MQHSNIRKNVKVAGLIQDTITMDQGSLSSTGALIVKTGKFTGRSPKDRYIVEDDITKSTVDWGSINIPIASSTFDALEEKMIKYAQSLDHIYMRDAYACASRKYRINIKVVINLHLWVKGSLTEGKCC